MANEQGEQGQGGSIFDTLKKALLVFLLVSTVSNFLGKNIAGDDDNASSVNTSASDHSKRKPNPSKSSYSIFKEPSVGYKIVEMTGAEGEVLKEKVKTVEQILYENSQQPPRYLYPMWGENSYPIDLKFYVNDKKNVDESESPIYTLSNVTIEGKNDVTQHFTLRVPDTMKFDNGSLYLHTYISRPGFNETGHKTVQLSTYMPKKKAVKLHKLIGQGDDEVTRGEQVEDDASLPIVPFWHPNVTISIAKAPGLIDLNSIPPPMADVFPLDSLDRRDNSTGQIVQYFPIIYQNKFWQLKDHMSEINDTIDEIDLNLSIDFAAFWKIQALVLFSDGMKQQENNPMSMTDGSEIDSIKKILLDTNPYLLGITVLVSLLHSLLEFLAFKSDISHWRNKKNNVGVSVRSIVANVVQQTITLLYLIDNSEGTSVMILASQGFGILVEAWKITTIVNIEIEWSGVIPNVKVTDKYKLSETEEKTKEYDSIAFKYLYWVAVPLLIAYAIYSLIYKEHKSWYSFVVTTLVGFVYTYGFLTLIPSVYINYRLKSVAHVPKKAMAYKVVNTFIDDLFAFVVKMPWLHRLATLRDDVIFFIYLYQTWIYRVDYSRVNEYGQGGDDAQDVEEVVEEKDGQKVTKKETKKQR
jgi:hypothetical protein